MGAPNLSKNWTNKPGFVMLGDSTAHQSNVIVTPPSITAVGTRATIESNISNMLSLGQHIVILGANESAYNGVFVIDEVVDATHSKCTLAETPSASPATGTPYAVLTAKVKDQNYAVISNAMGGGKGIFLGNYALSGAGTSSLSTQIDLAFEPTNNLFGVVPDIAFISIGVNDARSVGFSLATVTANLEAAIARILGYGAYPVILTNWPYDNTYSGWTVTYANNTRRINDWIRQNVPILGGIVIDANTISMDMTNQYGNWKSGYSPDGLHPGKVGGFQVAKSIKTNFWDLISTPTDARSLTEISANSGLTGTGGATSGTGASGSVASNFTVIAAGGGAQTVVAAKGIPLTGSGESQRLTVTAAVDDDSGALRSSSFHASVTAGDKIVCQVRVRTESACEELKYINLTGNVTVGGVTTLKHSNAIDTNATADRWAEKFDLTLETPPITVQANTTSLYFELKAVFGAAGSAVFDVDSFKIYKVG